MNKIKDLTKEHKLLKKKTQKITKQRLDDRFYKSWSNLRDSKKLKLKLKDKMERLKK